MSLVNYDHCFLALRGSLRMMRYLPMPWTHLPMAQAIWYYPQGDGARQLWRPLRQALHAPGVLRAVPALFPRVMAGTNEEPAVPLENDTV
jgi:hypothetical protein